MPNVHMFSICLLVKLAQSVVTVICQIAFLAQVNSVYLSSTSPTSLAYLGINITSTIMIFVVNLFSAVISIRLLKRLDRDPSSKVRIVTKEALSSEYPANMRRASIFAGFNPLHTMRRLSSNVGNTTTTTTAGGDNVPSTLEIFSLKQRIKKQDIEIASINKTLHLLLASYPLPVTEDVASAHLLAPLPEEPDV